MDSKQRDDIVAAARGSSAARYVWRKRGRAPVGYVVGMALSYGRSLERLRAGHAAMVVAAKPAMGPSGRDALAHCRGQFRSRRWSVGSDTLRCLFVLLMGLGMRESSGRYCEGRDRSASNATANTAEAGLFQTSWNVRACSPGLLAELMREHAADASDGFCEYFREGVTCSAADLRSYGTGPGRQFQDLQRAKPHFAVETAAVGLRLMRRHWGPINRHEAETRPEVDALLRVVESIINQEVAQP